MLNSQNNNSREWLKVSELESGMQIAVPRAGCFAMHNNVLADDSLLSPGEGDIMWDEIAEIRELPEEQVWDIEVEGTHNFVAGHLIDKNTGKQFTEEEEKEWIKAQGTEGHGGMLSKTKSKSVAGWFGGIFAHNTYITASATIGTTTAGTYGFRLGSAASGKNAMIGNGALCVDNNDECGGAMTAGSVYAVGAYSQTADYAEYFYTNDTDLESGEIVCIDVAKDNAVKRCQNRADGNLMGIVSTKPAFTGNATDETRNNPNYKIIGMLGQLPTKASAENGAIRPGDSLTSSATMPGYAMRADSGDSTVGVALEALTSPQPSPSQGEGVVTGKINVLVSRRNKSLTVAEIESKVVERIAAMEIEDEVAILVANAVAGYNFDPIVEEKIIKEVDALEMSFGLSLEQKVAELTNLINKNKLSFIKEEDGKVSINTNLTITGALEADGGIIVPLSHFALNGEGKVGSGTPAFKAASDGTVTAYNDFVISDGITATSVKDTLAVLGAEDMAKTNLTAKQDLIAGETLTVWGSSRVLGSAVLRSGYGAMDRKPVFKVAMDGTITVRDNIIFSGYSEFKEIANIVDAIIYDANQDIDSGNWTSGAIAKASSWHNEPMDGSSVLCDIESNDRCGTRVFPSKAIISATTDAIYIFDANDSSLWMKFSSELFQQAGQISAIRALWGSIYIAQETGIMEIDFNNDKIRLFGAQNQTPLKHYKGTISERNSGLDWEEPSENTGQLISSPSIRSISASFINGNKYLAIAGESGIDFINLDALKASNYQTSEAKNIWLTSNSDLYFASESDLSAIYKASSDNEDLTISARYSASTTPALTLSGRLSGIYVSERTSIASSTKEIVGNTAYIASASKIFVISENQKHKEKSSIKEYDQTEELIKGFSVDEESGVIYAIGENSVRIMAQASGAILDEIESASGTMASAMTFSKQSFQEKGAPQSDLFALASAEGLLIKSSDYSLRSAVSELGRNKAKTSSRVSVIDDQIFSGRLIVKDNEKNPLFAVNEKTGNVSIREDIVFSSDAKMAPVSGVKKVLVYDTTKDSNGGEWRNSAFPQKTIIAVANEFIYVYDAKDKALWTKLGIPAEYLSGFGIGEIIGITAKDGIIRIYGNIVLEFNILKNTVAQISDASYKQESPVISQEAQTAMDQIYSSIQNISSISNNNLLISGIGIDGKAAVVEIGQQGTIIDIWSNDEAREDGLGVPYSAKEVLSADASENVMAIAVIAQTGDEFIWMETKGFSLREELNAPKAVFTVTDALQTPRIKSVTDLSFLASTTISFYSGATSTPVLVISDLGKVQAKNLEAGNLEVRKDLSVSGILRIGNLSENYYDFSALDNGSLVISKNNGTLSLVISDGKVGIGSLGQAGSLCLDDGTGVCGGLTTAPGDIYYKAAHAEYTDVAENYLTEDASLGAGEIVMLSSVSLRGSDTNSDLLVSRANGGSKVLGIVSTNPGLTLGDYGDNSVIAPARRSGGRSEATKQSRVQKNVPVALSGRAPVKVSLENGPIVRGDYLTLSKKVPGAAMKLIGSGQVIGIALQDYDGRPIAKLTKDQDVHQVMAFIQQFYNYDDSSIVRVFDSKILDVQKQIDELRTRVESLEKWKAKQEE